MHDLADGAVRDQAARPGHRADLEALREIDRPDAPRLRLHPSHFRELRPRNDAGLVHHHVLSVPHRLHGDVRTPVGHFRRNDEIDARVLEEAARIVDPLELRKTIEEAAERPRLALGPEARTLAAEAEQTADLMVDVAMIEAERGEPERRFRHGASRRVSAHPPPGATVAWGNRSVSDAGDPATEGNVRYFARLRPVAEISMIAPSANATRDEGRPVAFSLRRMDNEGEPDGSAGEAAPTMEQLRQVLHDRIEKVLSPAALWLHRGGARANQISVAGFLTNAAAAALIVTDHLAAAGALYLLAGVLDLLDGTLARLAGRPTRFGAFLDSTLDRASEGIVFAAIGYRFAVEGSATDAGIVVLALLGSFLVSYVRARAEGLGAECKAGIATRAERVVLVGLGLVSGMLAEAIRLVALLTAVTVAQRIARARRELHTPDRLTG